MQVGAAPERKERIFTRQPSDGVMPGLPGVPKGCLLEIIGSVYGLVNSPRLWFQALRDRLFALGWVNHSLDSAFFIYKDANKVVFTLATHVDDVLMTINPAYVEKVTTDLRNSFQWGRWKIDEMTFCGRGINRKNGVIYVDQKDFISGCK